MLEVRPEIEEEGFLEAFVATGVRTAGDCSVSLAVGPEGTSNRRNSSAIADPSSWAGPMVRLFLLARRRASRDRLGNILM